MSWTGGRRRGVLNHAEPVLRSDARSFHTSVTCPPARRYRRQVLLEVEDLSARYGDVEVLHAVSLSVAAGEVVALLGANGAGKTTTLRAVSGLVRASAGRVRVDGRVLAGTRPHAVVAAGVGHVPEGRRVFARMTARENLEMGAYSRGSADRDTAADLERVHSLFPVLAERSGQLAGTLSGGEQQMLAVGRALMGRPRLLLLDEPSMGLAPQVVETLFAVIGRVHEDGTAVLLVEQDAVLALTVAARAVVLENGRVVLTGSAADLRGAEGVAAAYLGG
jgi:branched-chain amino acid transport system ATP-binding protein